MHVSYLTAKTPLLHVDAFVDDFTRVYFDTLHVDFGSIPVPCPIFAGRPVGCLVDIYSKAADTSAIRGSMMLFIVWKVGVEPACGVEGWKLDDGAAEMLRQPGPGRRRSSRRGISWRKRLPDNSGFARGRWSIFLCKFWGPLVGVAEPKADAIWKRKSAHYEEVEGQQLFEYLQAEPKRLSKRTPSCAAVVGTGYTASWRKELGWYQCTDGQCLWVFAKSKEDQTSSWRLSVRTSVLDCWNAVAQWIAVSPFVSVDLGLGASTNFIWQLNLTSISTSLIFERGLLNFVYELVPELTTLSLTSSSSSLMRRSRPSRPSRPSMDETPIEVPSPRTPSRSPVRPEVQRVGNKSLQALKNSSWNFIAWVTFHVSSVMDQVTSGALWSETTPPVHRLPEFLTGQGSARNSCLKTYELLERLDFRAWYICQVWEQTFSQIIQRCTKITNTLLTLAKRVAKLEQLVYLLDCTHAQVEEQLKQILFRDMGDAKPQSSAGSCSTKARTRKIHLQPLRKPKNDRKHSSPQLAVNFVSARHSSSRLKNEFKHLNQIWPAPMPSCAGPALSSETPRETGWHPMVCYDLTKELIPILCSEVFIPVKIFNSRIEIYRCCQHHGIALTCIPTRFEKDCACDRVSCHIFQLTLQTCSFSLGWNFLSLKVDK